MNDIIMLFMWVAACITMFFVGRSLGFQEALSHIR